MFAGLIAFVLKLATGGTLDRVLAYAERKADSATERERIASEIVREQVRGEIERRNAQKDVLVAGNRWLQWLFVIPLGIWFSAVIADSIFYFSWNVAALPPPLDDWAGLIISALFLVDAAPKVAAQFRRK